MSRQNSLIRVFHKDFGRTNFSCCHYLTVPHNSHRSSLLNNRRLYSSVPAAEKSHFSDRLLTMPHFVQKKLEKIKVEVVNSISDQPILSASLARSSSFFASDFTQKLRKMAEYYFNQSGKLLRPTVSLLMAYACNQLNSKDASSKGSGIEEVTLNQYRIAMISEMIHTASLVHDDVIDESAIRRGKPTVNALWGNKMAVLVGDFILARATQILCSIGRPSVISVMALIIEDLVKGEFMQMTSGGEKENAGQFDEYMAKTYSKTASLFANSCKSAAMLADVSESVEATAYEYGRSLGIAFQLVDDMLDFVSTSAVMGKPTANDLKLGLATAPVLFAAEEYPEIYSLISRRFSQEGDVQKAYDLVVSSRGLEKTRSLAKNHAQQAKDMAAKFPNGEGVRDLLVDLAMSQLERQK